MVVVGWLVRWGVRIIYVYDHIPYPIVTQVSTSNYAPRVAQAKPTATIAALRMTDLKASPMRRLTRAAMSRGKTQ